MHSDERVEGDFYQYMHQIGQVDNDWNQKVLAFYVQHFSDCHRVLDVGCGEGQFIELLSAEGVDVVGIDVDAQMVKHCRDKGYRVFQENLFDYLPKHRGAFDGVFSSNLIEHLSSEEGFRFVELAFACMPPGGVFLTATPNPASLIVHLHEFWRDATHVRLYTASLLEFMLSRSGFEDVSSGENPQTAWTPPPALGRVPRSLKRLSASVRDRQTQYDFPTDASRMSPGETPSFWQRLISSLRRRVASFLAENVLYEEFAGLYEALSSMRTDMREDMLMLARVDRALYDHLSKRLVVPREVYAKGVKPSDTA